VEKETSASLPGAERREVRVESPAYCVMPGSVKSTSRKSGHRSDGLTKTSDDLTLIL